jgi:hypothetical protein
MSTTMVLAFVGLKVALFLVFWLAAVKGFALRDRIEARKRAEREALLSAPQVDAGPAPSRGELSRPAA